MTTYTEEINGVTYAYFFDTNIKSWTVLKVDQQGNQIGEADYQPNKKALLSNYPFTFKACT